MKYRITCMTIEFMLAFLAGAYFALFLNYLL